MPDLPDLSEFAAKPKKPKDYRDLSQIAQQKGFTVTSTTGGTHNRGSKHPAGLAIDVRTRDKSPEEIQQYMDDAKSQGIIVKDERTRPPGQKVWKGPHLHEEVGGQTPPDISEFSTKLPDISEFAAKPIEEPTAGGMPDAISRLKSLQRPPLRPRVTSSVTEDVTPDEPTPQVTPQATPQVTPLPFKADTGSNLSFGARAAQGWGKLGQDKVDSNPNSGSVAGQGIKFSIPTKNRYQVDPSEYSKAALRAMGPQAVAAGNLYKNTTGNDLVKPSRPAEELRRFYNRKTKAFEFTENPAQEITRVINALNSGGVQAAKAEIAKMQQEEADAQKPAPEPVQSDGTLKGAVNKAVDVYNRNVTQPVKHGLAEANISAAQTLDNMSKLGQMTYQQMANGVDSPEWKQLENQNRVDQAAIDSARSNLPEDNGMVGGTVRAVTSAAAGLPQQLMFGPTVAGQVAQGALAVANQGKDAAIKGGLQQGATAAAFGGAGKVAERLGAGKLGRLGLMAGTGAGVNTAGTFAGGERDPRKLLQQGFAGGLLGATAGMHGGEGKGIENVRGNGPEIRITPEQIASVKGQVEAFRAQQANLPPAGEATASNPSQVGFRLPNDPVVGVRNDGNGISVRDAEGRRFIADRMAEGMSRDDALRAHQAEGERLATEIERQLVPNGIYRLPGGMHVYAEHDPATGGFTGINLDSETGRPTNGRLFSNAGFAGAELVGEMGKNNPLRRGQESSGKATANVEPQTPTPAVTAKAEGAKLVDTQQREGVTYGLYKAGEGGAIRGVDSSGKIVSVKNYPTFAEAEAAHKGNAAGPAKPYEYKPLDVSQDLSGTTMYHGTKAPIQALSEADPAQFAKTDALYGHGLYLTDNPEVAKGYAQTKGKGASGQVLSAELGNAKLLDLEQPLPPDVQRVFDQINIDGPSDRSAPTGKEVFNRLKEDMHDAGMTASDATEAYQDLTASLQELGYDGFRHEGGAIKGQKHGPHNVAIIFPDYGVGRSPESLLRESGASKAQTPTPEAPATINTQMEALQKGARKAVLITPGEQMPEIPKGFKVTETKDGQLIHSEKFPSQMVKYADKVGTIHKLLGIEKPKVGTEDAALTARTPDGTEAQSVAVDTNDAENIQKQAKTLEEQNPGSTVTLENPEKVIAEREQANNGPELGEKPEVIASRPMTEGKFLGGTTNGRYEEGRIVGYLPNGDPVIESTHAPGHYRTLTDYWPIERNNITNHDDILRTGQEALNEARRLAGREPTFDEWATRLRRRLGDKAMEPFYPELWGKIRGEIPTQPWGDRPPDVTAHASKSGAQDIEDLSKLTPNPENVIAEREAATSQNESIPPAVEPEHHSNFQPRSDTGTFVEGKPVPPKVLPDLSTATPQRQQDGIGETGEPQVKKRSLPESLEAAGLPKGNDLTYEVFHDKDAQETATKVVDAQGIDKTIEQIKSRDMLDKQDVANAFDVSRRLYEQAKAETDPAKQAELYDKADQFAADLSRKATVMGQGVQAFSLVSRYAPERVAGAAQKAYEQAHPGKKMPAKAVRETVTQAEKIKGLEDRLATVEKQLADADPSAVKAVASKGPVRRTARTLAEDWADKAIADAQARLAERKVLAQKVIAGKSEAGASIIPEDIADYATIFAAKVIKGGITTSRIADQMIDDFGREIEPYMAKIRREGAKLYRDRMKETREQAEIHRVTEGKPEDFTPEQIQELIKLRKEGIKARGADLRALNKEGALTEPLAKKAKVVKPTVEGPQEPSTIVKQIRQSNADEVVKTGASKFTEPGMTLEKWKQEMVSEFGKEAESRIDNIRRQSAKLYRESKQALKAQAPAKSPEQVVSTEARKGTLAQVNKEGALAEPLKQKPATTKPDSVGPEKPAEIARRIAAGGKDSQVSLGAMKLLRKDMTPRLWEQEMAKDTGLNLKDKKKVEQVFKEAYALQRDAREALKSEAETRAVEKPGMSEAEIAQAINERRMLRKETQQAKSAFDAHMRRLEMSTGQKALGVVADVGNVPRSLQSGFDLSMAGRQGVFLASEPKAVMHAMGEQVKSLVSENSFENFADSVANHPRAKLAQQSGLELTSQKPDHGLGRGEEGFMSRLALKLPHVKASERAAVTYLDSMRIELFDKFAKELEDSGFKHDKHAQSYKDLARFLNVATGRGELGKRGQAMAPFLNMLYSPKLLKSRFQLLNPVFYARLAPGARKIAIRKALQFYSGVPIALALASTALTAAGVKNSVSYDDIDNPDWMKLRVGNTSYEISGGVLPVARFVAKMARAGSLAAKGERHEDFEKIGRHFLRSKLGPVPSLAVDRYTGREFTGDKFQWVDTDPKTKVMGIPTKGAIPSRLLPLYIQDTMEAMRDVGPVGAVKSVPGVFGVGASTYERKPGQKDSYTPAEKTVRLIQQGKMGDFDNRTEADDARKDIKTQLAGKLKTDRAQAIQEIRDAVKSGAIKRDDVNEIANRSKQSDLAYRVSKLSLTEAMEIWDKASDTEQKELAPVIARKLKDSKDPALVKSILPKVRPRLTQPPAAQ